MKTAHTLLIAATCAQFISSAREATGPQLGDAPATLGLESILQGIGGPRLDWTALKGKVVVPAKRAVEALVLAATSRQAAQSELQVT